MITNEKRNWPSLKTNAQGLAVSLAKDATVKRFACVNMIIEHGDGKSTAVLNVMGDAKDLPACAGNVRFIYNRSNSVIKNAAFGQVSMEVLSVGDIILFECKKGSFIIKPMRGCKP